ncbi:MAG: hypothetical protein NC898_03085 [Candidatus Omnitrophica bacterium]|nr:hypothetical protein [Candidatus Omnitrophota bacterium]
MKLAEGVEVTLKNKLPAEWQNAQWIFGGGMILMDKDITPWLYKELYAQNLDIKKIVDYLDQEVMQREGWDTYISRDSQATDPGVTDGFYARTPRQMIGVTESGKFFVFSFSGRNTRNSGVSYAEALLIIKDLVGDEKIKCIMSLDDGASVNLGVIYNAGDGSKYYLLNLTSPGVGGSSGDIRPVNSLFVIEPSK